ncbi:ABC transporter permease [Lacrimispora celerecrescens]|uniref:Putative ABC transport system permease protein n=1 Tax=[Clostridium] celerecrescens 18A TaxID=1286362 RepID=A0A2M8Z4T3_9FIRM|nr:FtsX-like permease family protein [Lacrimispora celerecrescens]PJJ28451.1 putative ABC transport system permease protein [[Clostridium] celerecrescens 18A]
MKSYLDLVSLSAKVHKRQNRMSVFCIVLAVFLVTAIFGMADMFIRSQIMQARMEDGNWHVMVRNINEEQAALISARPDVTASSWYGVLNFRGDQGYTVSGKDAIIFGSDKDWITKMQTQDIRDGAFPQDDQEAMVTENVKTVIGMQIGDVISVDGPDGNIYEFTISGFLNNGAKTMEEDSYGVCLTTKAFRSLYPGVTNGDPAEYNSVFCVQFSTHSNIRNTIDDMKSQLGLSDEQVSENTKLLGLLGQSGNSFMLQIYSSAAVLFLLVLLAGIMMIASSLNSNVAQRTEFFGMMRCIGATPKQVMRFVRKEALGWCKFAIPLGISTGAVVIWILCAILRFLSPEYFAGMPAFGISLPSIVAGISVGILTVLLAARSPAKRAAKVSPLAAVSGNANSLQPVRKAANTTLFKIDTALGFHHAKASKKNFVLMVGSFSLSIMLFLAFSVTIDFMHHSLTPLKPWTPDLSIVSPDSTCSIRSILLGEFQENPAVKRVYGRKFAYNVPVTVNGQEKKVDLISYEENQFGWAKNSLLEGSLDTVQQESNTGLIVFKPQNTIKTGDTATLHINGQTADIKIVGSLSASPFNSAPDVGTMICSENTFLQLTGETDYTIIDLQLSKNATEADVDEIHRMVGTEVTFSDKRSSNRSVIGSYYSFGLFIYGFMALIALITIFNIVNSLAMSVSSRMKQYGAFRAIGLSNRQLIKMIVAEASAYAITGSIFGSVVGLMLNKFLYAKLITFHWSEEWNIPFIQITIIIAVVLLSVILAVRGPVKRIRDMSIVDTISAQ